MKNTSLRRGGLYTREIASKLLEYSRTPALWSFSIQRTGVMALVSLGCMKTTLSLWPKVIYQMVIWKSITNLQLKQTFWIKNDLYSLPNWVIPRRNYPWVSKSQKLLSDFTWSKFFNFPTSALIRGPIFFHLHKHFWGSHRVLEVSFPRFKITLARWW